MFNHQDDNNPGGDPQSEDAIIANALSDDTSSTDNNPQSNDLTDPIITDMDMSGGTLGSQETPVETPSGTVSPEIPAELTEESATPPTEPEAKNLEDVISPAGGFPRQQTFPQTNNQVPDLPAPESGDPTPADDSNSDNSNDDLINIKHKALTELAPFVDELDLTAEDKFQTVMMVIQTNDDRTLIDKAFKLAHAIEDEKIKAQALLQVVNEINYFTHQKES